VLIGVIAGGMLGVPVSRNFGTDLKPLGDLFIRLIKMVFAPVIFAMVVLGIAKMESMKELGRVGCTRPDLFRSDVDLRAAARADRRERVPARRRHECRRPTRSTPRASATTRPPPAKSTGFVDFLLNMVPTSAVDALAKNDILQILVFATMFGIALSRMGRRAKPVVDMLEAFSNGMFIVSAWSCGSPHGRVRRHRLHGRQVRTGLAGLARPADGLHVPDLRGVRVHRAGHGRPRFPVSACGSSCASSRTRSSPCSAPARPNRWCRS
jgi:hypothetical protein